MSAERSVVALIGSRTSGTEQQQSAPTLQPTTAVDMSTGPVCAGHQLSGRVVFFSAQVRVERHLFSAHACVLPTLLSHGNNAQAQCGNIQVLMGSGSVCDYKKRLCTHACNPL